MENKKKPIAVKALLACYDEGKKEFENIDLRGADLRGAYYDSRTGFPKDFDPEVYGMENLE